jgi:hypothetical protein
LTGRFETDGMTFSKPGLASVTIGLSQPMSLPGLTGQSSTLGLCLLDRPVKPGNDIKQGST